MATMTANGKTAELAEAQDELETALAAYEVAKAKEDEARKGATNALNRLNAAQREFDMAVNAIRSTAPSSSDWAFQGQVKTAVLAANK
jgi:hypothetical protein